MCGGYHISPLGLIVYFPLALAGMGIQSAANGAKSATTWTQNTAGRIWDMTHLGAAQQKIIECNVKLTLNPKDTLALMQRSLGYIVQRKYSEATSDIDTVLQLEPSNYLAHYYKGFILDIMDDPLAAIGEYTKSIEAANESSTDREEISLFNNVKSKYIIAPFNKLTEDVDDALFEMKQQMPDPFGIRTLRQKRKLEAKAVSKVMNTKLTRQDLINNRGMVLFRIGEYYKALEDFETAVNTTSSDSCSDKQSTDQNNNSNLSLYLFNCGLVHYYVHSLEGAISYFTQAIHTISYLDDNNSSNNKSKSILVNAYVMRSFCYMRLNETKSAGADRGKALAIDPYAPVDQFHYRLLPESVFIHVLSFLDAYDLSQVELSGRQMRQLVYHPFLRKIVEAPSMYHYGDYDTEFGLQDYVSAL